MQGGIIKKGFTLLELSISMLFVSLLSIAIVVVINNVISAYQRGSVLSRLEGTGSSIVDDMRSSIQDAINYTRLGSNVSIVKRAKTMTIDGVDQTDIPIYGVFCTGSYTYFWNSGYFFSDDASFNEKQDSEKGWAKIQLSDEKDDFYNPYNVSDKPAFRLVKIQDTERDVCIDVVKNYTDGNKVINNNKLSNVFNIKKLFVNKDPKPEIIPVLQNDNNAELALYDLLVEIPATNQNESLSLYNVSFILGTTSGGVNIATSGNACATPVGDQNWNNACAVSKFNFVTESNASDLGVIEQIFLGEIPEQPEVEIPPQITYKNVNCPVNPLASHTEWNKGFVHQNNFFSCNEYEFVEWNTSQLGGEAGRYNPGDSIDPSTDHILYAIWKPAPKITYKNDNCENNTHSPKTILNNGTVLNYSDVAIGFTCGDATFVSWNTDVEGNGMTYHPGSSIARENYTLYAIWKPKVYYRVTYHGNGDTDSNDNILNSIDYSPNILENTAYTIKNNYSWQKRGYEFNGWSDGKGTTYNPGTQIVMNANIDLYAQWRLEGTEPTYEQEFVPQNDRFFDTIIVYPDTVLPGSTCYSESEGTVCYLANNITGQVDGSDTGIVRDKVDWNPKNTQDICESFSSNNQCPNSPHNDYILSVYRMSHSGTKSAVIYLEISNNNSININNVKDRFVFYHNPSSYNVHDYADFGVLYYNNIPGYTGYPSVWGCHPAIYYFPDLRDTLIATQNVSEKVEGKDAIVENSKPRYWVIMKLYYNGSSFTTMTPINRFTNTDPNSF